MKISFGKEKTKNIILFLEKGEVNKNSIQEHINIDLENIVKDFDFKGDFKEVLHLRSVSGFKNILLVGIGESKTLTPAKSISLGGFVVSQIKKEEEVSVYFGNIELENDVYENLFLGFKLKSWGFDKYISDEKKHLSSKLKELKIINLDEKKLNLSSIKAVTEGVNLARNLISEPANVIYPESYAKVVQELSKDGVKVTILDKKALEKEGMGALLSVGQGSEKPPFVVIMEYKGNPKSEEKLAFVGKGVTFDTGGYSLKPALSMNMKKDMSGAAAVVGLLKTLALRKAKVNAVGVIGLAENMISGSAMRVEDVVKSMSGKTIEILNTDAEGRLVLADVLWYTQKNFNPKVMINLATLTGAIIVSLGSTRAGLFSNNDELAKQIFISGEATGEKVWNMPMDEEYGKDLSSSVADLQNITLKNPGSHGSIFAAKFLEEFVNNVAWAHLDIAGASMISGSDINTGAPGFGVRLLDNFIKTNYENI